MTGKSDGFTLIEVLVAFVILSTSMAIGWQTIAIATRSIANSREREQVLAAVDYLKTEIVPTMSGPTAAGAFPDSGAVTWKAEVVTKIDAPLRLRVVAATLIAKASGHTYHFVLEGH